MNARLAAILVVLGALLAGSAAMFYSEQRSQQASNIGTLGQPVLPGLKAAEIATLRIREPSGTLTLAQKDGRWTIAERAGFAASHDRVRDFVLLAIALRIGQSEPIGEADRTRLKLDAEGPGMGTVIEFLDAGGKTLASLIAGAPYSRGAQAAAPGAAKPAADGRFVMRPQDPKTVYIVSDPLAQASTKSAGWIDPAGMVVERVKSMEVRRPGGERVRVERSNESTDWVIEGAVPAGMNFLVTRANAATYSLQLLGIADVAAPDVTPAQAGLEDPVSVVAQTFDGLTYTLEIGKREGQNHYARLRVEGTPAKERAPGISEKPEDMARLDKEFAAHLAKLEARLPRERELAQHIVLIDRVRLEDVLRKRDEYFEKKDAPK